MGHEAIDTSGHRPGLALDSLAACGLALLLVSTGLAGGCEEGPPSEGTAEAPSAETPATEGSAQAAGEGEGAVAPTGAEEEAPAPVFEPPVEWLGTEEASQLSEADLRRGLSQTASGPELEARLRHVVDPSRHPELSRPVVPPRSSSTAPLRDDKVVMGVSPEAVVVNLDVALALQAGAIPASARTASANPIIPALRDPLETAVYAAERWAMIRGTDAGPAASLLIDGEAPYALVATVMLNASAAGVTDFSAVVAEVPFEALWEPAGEASAVAAPLHALPIDSPRIQAGPRTGPPAPQLVVSISPEGFVLGDLADPDAFEAEGLSEPLPGCLPPVVVCGREGVASDRLLERLDFRGLYNRLVTVKRSARWAAVPDAPETARIYLTAEPGIPWEVLVRTMDVARAVLDREVYADDAAFFAARASDEALFPRVVLLLPTSTGSSTGALPALVPGRVEPTELGRAFDEAIAQSGALGRMFGGEAPTDLGEGDVYVVGRGEGGLGLRGTGPGGRGEGFGRVHGVGEIDTGGGRSASAELGRRGRRAPRARMDRGETSVDGSLEVAQVERVVRRHSRGLRYCYERELMDDPGLGGEVVIALTIGPDGHVVERSILSNQLDDSDVGPCLLREVGRMWFPEPADGNAVTVTQSLAYRAVR